MANLLQDLRHDRQENPPEQGTRHRREPAQLCDEEQRHAHEEQEVVGRDGDPQTAEQCSRYTGNDQEMQRGVVSRGDGRVVDPRLGVAFLVLAPLALLILLDHLVR